MRQPLGLIWRDENYYLAAYDSEAKVIKHYRVDKMGQVEVTVSPREGVKQFSQIDVTSYTNQTFGMFAGEESVVTMEFPKRLIGVVLDRFGREVDIRPMSDTVFRVRAKVAVSGQFFGWLAGIGPDARIAAPGSSTEALCTVASGYFAGTVGNSRLKIYPKIHPLFCIVF